MMYQDQNKPIRETEFIPLGKGLYFFKTFEIGLNKGIFYIYGEDGFPVLMLADFTLTSGSFVYRDDRIKLTSRAILVHRTIIGTAGILYYTVEDGKITFRSTSGSDNSIITAIIFF